ncbi:GerMN domain-containing protein [Bacillus inaquosorum]|uniref:GerMN domain-containing protein n=1 Tax=Bacillus inaquosorum TaxID=483913 RepID=UPI00227F6AFF|nr:GerMN domain-containing protein [Bacillus inaquosorum]MCY7902306.1 GerMN domain-containing protein [Bacillus inaquosorum]MCY8262066.1 GerMN domain-containing protein [Bacillus inaquosorum]MCY8282582.1 GerMN domain-containing protein [Bacillus inaquosorum]MCY9094174.1 GerMN domain-containing protein [Bacillus inaquosorum]MCY9456825.1 GerMN domain-containing protein [Bacillus inaquosorum]
MMKSDWNEEQIKELLSQLPAVKDHRSPQDIYKLLTMAKSKKKPAVRWIGPACATAIAVYIAFIISPHFFDQAQPQQKDASQENAVTKTETADSPKAASSLDQTSFVVPEKEQNNYTTVAIADAETSAIIPISIKKTNADQTIQDMLSKSSELDILDHPITIPSFIDEVEIKEKPKQKELSIRVHQLITAFSVKDDTLLKKLLKESLKWSPYEKIKFLSDQKNEDGAVIGSYGTFTEIPIPKQSKRAYYLYQNKQGQDFLVPSEKTFDTVKEAVKEMESSSQKDTTPLIQEGAVQSVTKKQKHLYINFSKDSEVEDSIAGILMLEGLLLTAKEFGFTEVTFTETRTKKIGRYDVSDAIPVPAAPNPISIN